MPLKYATLFVRPYGQCWSNVANWARWNILMTVSATGNTAPVSCTFLSFVSCLRWRPMLSCEICCCFIASRIFQAYIHSPVKHVVSHKSGVADAVVPLNNAGTSTRLMTLRKMSTTTGTSRRCSSSPATSTSLQLLSSPEVPRSRGHSGRTVSSRQLRNCQNGSAQTRRHVCVSRIVIFPLLSTFLAGKCAAKATSTSLS